MKPNSIVEMTNENNFDESGTESIEFSVDENSLAHLQTLLSDLYSNRKLATLRELSTNAYDAQVEAGHVGPIHISLPTTMNPTLTVRDFGIGMDKDDFANVYTKYAASTKRDTQDQVGTLGLGSKAPLALTDSFSVKSVKNGTLISAVVFRNTNNLGEMQILHTEDTTEHSGTTINIPVDADDVGDFAQLAAELFQFWPENSVLVDGAQPEQLKGEKLSEEFFIANNLNKDYLVMGNIPYRVEIPSELIPSNRNRPYYYRDSGGFLPEEPYSKKFGIVMFAPMGAVDFTPSREALNYTKRTAELLLEARETGFPHALESYYKEQMSAKETKTEAFDFYLKWLENPFNFKPARQWRGHTIPGEFLATGYLWSHIHKENRGWGGWSMNTHNAFKTGDFENLKETLIVTDFTSVNRPVSVMKRKTKLWLETHHPDVTINYVLYVSGGVDFDGWVTPLTVSSDVVKKMKLPESQIGANSTNTGPRKWKTFTFKVKKDGVTMKNYSEKYSTSEELSGEIVYLSPSENEETYEYFAGKCGELSDDPSNLSIVFVRKNQNKTFLKENPNAVHYYDWGKKALKKITSTPFTYAERLEVSSRWLDHSTFHLDPDRIDDPDLAAYIRTGKEVFLSEDYKKHGGRLRKLEKIRQIFQLETPTPETIENPMEKYPLCQHINLRSIMYIHKETNPALEALYEHLNFYYAYKIKRT